MTLLFRFSENPVHPQLPKTLFLSLTKKCIGNIYTSTLAQISWRTYWYTSNHLFNVLVWILISGEAFVLFANSSRKKHSRKFKVDVLKMVKAKSSTTVLLVLDELSLSMNITNVSRILQFLEFFILTNINLFRTKGLEKFLQCYEIL